MPLLTADISAEPAQFAPLLAGDLLSVAGLSSHRYCLHSLLHIILRLFVRLLLINLWCFDERGRYHCCFRFKRVLFNKFVIIHSKWISNVKRTWLDGWRRLWLYCFTNWFFIAFAQGCYIPFGLLPDFIGNHHLTRSMSVHFNHSCLSDGPRLEFNIGLDNDIVARRVSGTPHNVNESVLTYLCSLSFESL
jgi:hypothetical protein